jgi:hypothetical protein
VLRRAPVGLRLKAALPIAADLQSHGNVSPTHLTAFRQRSHFVLMPAVTARLVQHVRAFPRQRMTALQKHEQGVSKSCNLRSARNLSACLSWSAMRQPARLRPITHPRKA